MFSQPTHFVHKLPFPFRCNFPKEITEFLFAKVIADDNNAVVSFKIHHVMMYCNMHIV